MDSYSLMTTFAPSLAKRRAVERPMPYRKEGYEHSGSTLSNSDSSPGQHLHTNKKKMCIVRKRFQEHTTKKARYVYEE